MNRNTLIFGGLIVVLIILIFFAFRFIQTGGKTADIKGQSIKLEIADSPEERQKGLSKRESLPQDTGMVFIFDKDDTYSFWMKDMQFPIDIIFLKDTKVVSVFHEVPAFVGQGDAKTQNMTLYAPKTPANRVLELNAGQAKKYGLKEGDTITFNL